VRRATTAHLAAARSSNNPLLAARGSQVSRTFDQYPRTEPGCLVCRTTSRRVFNNTESGFYHLNYDSRLPIASGYAFVTSQVGRDQRIAAVQRIPGEYSSIWCHVTTLEEDKAALQGEVSYHPNQPLQISAVELISPACRR
jgi:hypothetical protein